MSTIVVCVECGLKVLIHAEGDVNIGSLCSDCKKKLMRELEPNGFPKHREFSARGRERQMVWREPRE
jgi:DNA-directed RNA polymerase subunit RPC12/RpoP